MILYLCEEAKLFYDDRNQISGLKHVVGEWCRRFTEVVTREILGVLVVIWVYTYVKSHKLVYSKCIKFIVHKLYLNELQKNVFRFLPFYNSHNCFYMYRISLKVSTRKW